MSVVQEPIGNCRAPRQTIDELRVILGDGPAGSPLAFEIPPGLRLADLVKAAVLQTLDRLGGNRTQAAQCLGISVRTLQRKLKQWNGACSSTADEVDDLELTIR
jgi:transcriptional regulator of acetoin/glycerol metabolism